MRGALPAAKLLPVETAELSTKTTEDQQPSVAAVFSTHQRREVALTAIRRLRAQTRPLQLIVVIDNASTDGTQDAIRGKFGSDPRVTLMQMPENIGNPAAVQQAITYALKNGAEWIWILDDDAWPTLDAAEKLLQSELNPDRVYASLALDPERHTLSWPSEAVSPTGGRMMFEPSELPRERVFQVRGAWLGSLVSRQAIERAGEVDGRLFIRGEDEEYPARLRAHGFTFFCVQDSVIHHPYCGDSIKIRLWGRNFYYPLGLAPWKAFYSVRNHAYVRRKYARTRGSGLISALLTVGLSIGLALLFDDEKFTRVALYFRAGRDALSERLGKTVVPPNG